MLNMRFFVCIQQKLPRSLRYSVKAPRRFMTLANSHRHESRYLEGDGDQCYRWPIDRALCLAARSLPLATYLRASNVHLLLQVRPLRTFENAWILRQNGLCVSVSRSRSCCYVWSPTVRLRRRPLRATRSLALMHLAVLTCALIHTQNKSHQLH